MRSRCTSYLVAPASEHAGVAQSISDIRRKGFSIWRQTNGGFCLLLIIIIV